MSRYYRSILNVQAVAPALDPDAQAFLTAAGITDATITSAINSLVLGLKSDGLWTKMKVIYPFVGGTATTHKFNLKDPRDLDAAFRLTFFGGITHSVNGMQGNGTNGYANAHFSPSSNLSTSSAHFAKYNRTDDLVGNKIDGVFQTTDKFFQNNYSAGNTVLGQVASVISYTPTDARGMHISTRTAANLIKYFQNNSLLGSNTSTITSLPSDSIFLMARKNSATAEFYNTYQVAFASLGDGLTDAESANLYTKVQSFQTALSRNV